MEGQSQKSYMVDTKQGHQFKKFERSPDAKETKLNWGFVDMNVQTLCALV